MTKCEVTYTIGTSGHGNYSTNWISGWKCSTHGYTQSGNPPITASLYQADDFMCPIGQIEAATEKALAEIAKAKGE